MDFLQSVLGDDYNSFAEKINAYNTANPDKAVKIGNLAGGAYVDVEKYNKLQTKASDLTARLEEAQKAGGASAQLQADLAKAQKELAEANGKLTDYERRAVVQSAKVSPEFVDYVAYEASKLVDDKTDFKAALTKFMEANPKYKASTHGVKVGTSPVTKKTSDGAASLNQAMNDAIRSQLRPN